MDLASIALLLQPLLGLWAAGTDQHVAEVTGEFLAFDLSAIEGVRLTLDNGDLEFPPSQVTNMKRNKDEVRISFDGRHSVVFNLHSKV